MPLFNGSQLINDDCYLIGISSERRWYPVYCKPNKEKKLAELAGEKHISWYLPTFPHHRITRGQRIETQRPMFPGYIFLQLDRQQNWQVKLSGLAIRILTVTEKTEPTLVNDLNLIRKFELLSRTQPVKVRSDLVPGKRFTIAHGQFKGTEGVIVKRKNRTEFIVHLDFLNFALATVPAMDIL